MKENITYTDISNCPTQEQLEQYVFSDDKNMNAHLIERHLLNCKICDDVVDGLMLLKDENELISSTKNIQSKITTTLQTKKSNSRSYLAIAAGLALLIGLTLYFSNRNEEQLADNNIQVPKETSSDDMNQNMSESKESNEDSENVIQEKVVTLSPSKIEPLAAKEDLKFKPNIKQPPADIANETVAETRLKANKESLTIESPNAGKLAKENADEKSLAIKSFEENSMELEKKAESAVMSDDASMSDVELNDKSKLAKKEVNSNAQGEVIATATAPAAVNLNQEVSEAKYKSLDKPMNERAISESNYKSGLLFYKEKKYEKAIKCFNVVLKYTNNPFAEDAQFYKAKCLLDDAKNDDAKIILQQIINQKGKYMNDAQTLINTLK